MKRLKLGQVLLKTFWINEIEFLGVTLKYHFIYFF